MNDATSSQYPACPNCGDDRGIVYEEEDFEYGTRTVCTECVRVPTWSYVEELERKPMQVATSSSCNEEGVA